MGFRMAETHSLTHSGLLLQVFAKLAVLLQQQLGKQEQLARTLHLVLHVQRLSRHTQQQPALYSVLVDILRGGCIQHGSAAVQTTLEIVAVILRSDTLSCGPFVDLGIVTWVPSPSCMQGCRASDWSSLPQGILLIH